MVRLHCSEQVVSSVIDARNDVRVTLRVSRPNDDNLVEAMLLLELTNVFAQMFHMRLLVLTGNHIVRAVFLVGRDKVRVIHRWKGLYLSHLRGKLTL